MEQNGHNTSGDEMNTWQLRQYITQGEQFRADHRIAYPHAHPDSVFVAQIGANYDPGVWEAIVNMVLYTQQQGVQCWLEEIMPQQGGFPLVDIAGMRDAGVMRAQLAGFEYVCLVDSDILPEEDLLLKMLKHDAPVVAPYIIEPDSGGQVIGGPQWYLGQGLKPMRWICASFMLCRTSIFNCPNTAFKTGTDDDLFFQQLWKYGHKPYMDTDVELKVTRGPQRPAKYTWDERWANYQQAYDASKSLPDRRPTDPNNEQTRDGVYIPFAFSREEVPI